MPLTCSRVSFLTPHRTTRTTPRARWRNGASPSESEALLLLALRPVAIGSLTCHSPTRPLPSHSEPPSASSLASPDRTLCLKAPFHSSSVRGSPVRPRRLALEILPCQCSLTGPLWGESESLSPALPGASGAFHHPSIYSLFKSGAPGHVAGREGRASGWERRFCNLPGEGLGFSRMTPLACDPLIHHL